MAPKRLRAAQPSKAPKGASAGVPPPKKRKNAAPGAGTAKPSMQSNWQRLQSKLPRAGSTSRSAATGTSAAASIAPGSTGKKAAARAPLRASHGAPKPPRTSDPEAAPAPGLRLNAALCAARAATTSQSQEEEAGSRWQRLQEEEAVGADQSRYLAMDCEMVGVGPGGRKSVLARATVVNYAGEVVYDKFVRPRERITDFRTFVSGIKAKHLKDKRALSVDVCQQEVKALLRGKIVVGHAVHNDFKALNMRVPPALVRDTSIYRPFMKVPAGNPDLKPRPQKLSKLCLEQLGLEIQVGEHDSGEDARAAMFLFRSARGPWERSLKREMQRGDPKAMTRGLSKDKATKVAIALARREVRHVDQVSGKKRRRR